MMRKTLLLLTVLGLTSIANATLNISLNGDTATNSIILAGSDTAVVGIHSDDVSDWVAYLDVTDDPLIATIVSSDFTENAGPDSSYYDYSYAQYWEYEITMADFAGGSTTPGVQFEVMLHGEGIGNIDILLYDGDINLIDTAVIIRAVPEPTTIALLGFGAVLILRKRGK